MKRFKVTFANGIIDTVNAKNIIEAIELTIAMVPFYRKLVDIIEVKEVSNA